MNPKEHRIYKYMSEPIRVAGLTLDEIAVIGLTIVLFNVLSSFVWKIVAMLTGSLGVYLIKKFKKMATGFSLKSFLHWHLGLRFGMPSQVPHSSKRIWLP